MKRISTLLIAAISLAFNSYSQCSVSNTSPGFTPGMTVSAGNQFTATGQLAVGTYPNGSVSTLVSPVYSYGSSTSTVNFGYHLNAANSPGSTINSYTIKIVFQGGSFSCTNTTPISVTKAGADYYFSIPSGTLGTSYFQVYLTFDVAGTNSKDLIASTFGTNANLAPAGIVLPVKFASFEATGNVKTNNLVWKVGTEDNLNGYNVERSFDGSNFSQIGFVPATGKTTYTFVDANPASTSYYRIKSIDIDGKYGYSSVVLVKAGGSSAVMKAFPSPVTNSVTLQHSTVTEGTNITISSADGRLYKTVVPMTGTQQTVVDLSTAKPGLYLARYANAAGEVSTIKIIKQ